MTQLWLALDGPQSIGDIVEATEESVDGYKVGLRSFYQFGAAGIRNIKRHGKKVFLDLKCNDVPSQVCKLIWEISKDGVDYLTVSCSPQNEEMLKQAARETKAIGVTRLLGFIWPTSGKVMNIDVFSAGLEQAHRLGLNGVILPAQMDGLIRSARKRGLEVVCPGVRPEWAPSKGDHVSSASPTEAIGSGATGLVVGSPIYGAPDVKSAANSIRNEMEAADYAVVA